MINVSLGFSVALKQSLFFSFSGYLFNMSNWARGRLILILHLQFSISSRLSFIHPILFSGCSVLLELRRLYGGILLPCLQILWWRCEHCICKTILMLSNAMLSKSIYVCGHYCVCRPQKNSFTVMTVESVGEVLRTGCYCCITIYIIFLVYSLKLDLNLVVLIFQSWWAWQILSLPQLWYVL